LYSKNAYSDEQVFRAIMLLRICSIAVIFFAVDARVNIPEWMYSAFKNATYPLFIYNTLLFIFTRKVNRLLKRYPLLLAIDLIISIGLMLIGAGWRSSYLAYTFTTIIIFTLFLNLKGTWVSTLLLFLVSIVKDPSPGGEDLLAFSTSNLDMRLGAALAYIIAGVIIGYFRFLLDKIRLLSEERVKETEKRVEVEQKMKLALDLHDNIKSKINAIALAYNPVLKRLFREKPGEREELLRLWKWLYYLQSETMRFFIALKSGNAPDTASFNLVDFVKEEITVFKEITRFSWYLTFDREDVMLPFATRQSVLQFIGEGMLNAWKHSGVHEGVIQIIGLEDKKQRLPFPTRAEAISSQKTCSPAFRVSAAFIYAPKK
jgi:signal transduction histidine kinase